MQITTCVSYNNSSDIDVFQLTTVHLHRAETVVPVLACPAPTSVHVALDTRAPTAAHVSVLLCIHK